MRLLSGEQMVALDKHAIEQAGVPSMVLMESAGRAVAEEIELLCEDAPETLVAVFCGSGNNGGDGFVIARHLLTKGYRLELFLVGCRPEKLQGDCAKQAAMWIGEGGRVTVVEAVEQLEAFAAGAPAMEILCVDALFGTGLQRPLQGVFADVVRWMNEFSDFTVSVDLPSGLQATSGEVLGEAVVADLTVTLGFAKQGLVDGAGPEIAGLVLVADIGIPVASEEAVLDAKNHPLTYFIDEQEVRQTFVPRAVASHKGDYGHVLLIAGSRCKSGAARLASMAAMRAGAGLVTLATPESAHSLIKPSLDEVMSLPLSESAEGQLDVAAIEAVIAACAGKSVVAVGPGLDNNQGLEKLLAALLSRVDLPIVIDADGLNALAPQVSLLPQALGQLVLTPHPKEMARLLGCTSDVVQAARLPTARSFASDNGITLVLKGARTLVASPSGEVLVNPTGNPGMASAGMGDVLTGVIAGYLAQTDDILAAVCAAVYIHGLVADRLLETRGEQGLLASDLIDALPKIQSEFYPHAASGIYPS